MNSKRFLNALFPLVLIALILTGWQVEMVRAGNQTTGLSSDETGKTSGQRNLNVILLNNQGYKKKRKGPVEFTHKEHVYQYRLFCWDCHHDYKDGQDIWVPWGKTQRCSECHNPKNKERNNIMLQKAYHYQCKGCHKDLAKKKMKTGAYRKCGGCHLKKESK